MVSIGYDIAQHLPGLRREAESRMTETVTVGIYTDATDPDTGNPMRTLTTTRYTGSGRIRYGSRGVVNINAPGQPATVQEPYLSVPVGSPRLIVGDDVEVSASVHDPLLSGRRYRIQGNASAGQVTAARYPLEELS